MCAGIFMCTFVHVYIVYKLIYGNQTTLYTTDLGYMACIFLLGGTSRRGRAVECFLHKSQLPGQACRDENSAFHETTECVCECVCSRLIEIN